MRSLLYRPTPALVYDMACTHQNPPYNHSSVDSPSQNDSLTWGKESGRSESMFDTFVCTVYSHMTVNRYYRVHEIGSEDVYKMLLHTVPTFSLLDSNPRSHP